MRTEKKIFVIVVQLREGANNVPAVSANAEFVDAANINGNAHVKDLTTECTEATEKSFAAAID